MQENNNPLLETAQEILTEVRKAVVGKETVLLWVLAAIFARGHILLEDIPGVGKTTMAVAFSKVLGLSCNRVQFTPDVLPSDVTGYSVLDQKTGKNLPFDSRKMTKKELIEIDTYRFLNKYGYDRPAQADEPEYQDTLAKEIKRIVDYIKTSEVL